MQREARKRGAARKTCCKKARRRARKGARGAARKGEAGKGYVLVEKGEETETARREKRPARGEGRREITRGEGRREPGGKEKTRREREV